MFSLFNRVHQRLLLREVGEDGVDVGLCDRQVRDGLVAEVKDIAFVFLAEHTYLGEVYNVFSVASDEAAALETFFYGLETAA